MLNLYWDVTLMFCRPRRMVRKARLGTDNGRGNETMLRMEIMKKLNIYYVTVVFSADLI